MMNNDKKKQEELFHENRKIVPWIILNRLNLQITDDLLQIGYIGLWKACLSFDENKGVKFISYASTCILNELRMDFRKQNNGHKGDFITVSLDAPIKNSKGENFSIADIVADDTNLIEEYLSSQYCSDIINKVLSGYKEEYVNVFKLFLKDITQREIAKNIRNFSTLYK